MYYVNFTISVKVRFIVFLKDYLRDLVLKKTWTIGLINLFCIQVGERIRVILDCDDNTLAFERNYEFLGVAFRGKTGLLNARLLP